MEQSITTTNGSSLQTSTIDLDKMNTLKNILLGFNEKKKESYNKRSKAMMKHINFEPYEDWYVDIGRQLSVIGGYVSDAILSIYSRGGSTQYIDSVVFELAGYQLKNAKKICDYVVKNYDDSKALPTLPFWLRSITAVKSSQPIAKPPVTPSNYVISKEEQSEVQVMMKQLGEQLGVEKTKKGMFHNKTTLIHHYGILKNLNGGLRQIDGGEYEWVEAYNVGNRRTVDHSKTLDMFNSGRISEKKAREVYERSNGSK